MDKAPTLLLQLGLDGSPASLWVLAIGLTLALVMSALMLARLITLLQTRAQTRGQLNQAMQDLRLSRDELNLTVEAAGDGHWNWDMRHSTPHLQGPLYREFDLGDLSTTVDSARWSALIHPDDLKNTQAELSAYLHAPVGTFIARFRLQDREGHWRWIVSRGKAVQVDANGRVGHMIGVHYDETARREAELTAREENAKFSGIFTTLPDAAGSSRISDGRYIEVNAAFERVLGYSRAEVVGKTSIELNIWANQGERDKLLNAYATYGRVDRLEIMARTKSGQLMPGQMSASPALIGGEDCFVFVFRDLTTEKKIAAELNFSQSALDAAGRMGRMGAWVIYYDGTQPDYWSPVCREMVGISLTEPVPQDFTERFVLPEHRQTLRDLERRSREQLIGWDIELAIQRPDRETLWIRIVSEPVVENGRLVCTQGLMQDVDASHRAVDLLRQSEERFSSIFRFLPEAMAIIDAVSGYYLDVNPAWETMTGLARADVLGKTTSKIGLVSRTVSQQKRKLWAADGVYTDEEVEITTQRGEQRTSLISMRAMTLNGVNCWITMHRDITERLKAQAQIQEREEQLSLSMAAANLGMWDLNLTNYTTTGNNRWRELRGLSYDENPVSLESIRVNTHPDDVPFLRDAFRAQFQEKDKTMDFVCRTFWPDGSTHWIRDLGRVVARGADGRAVRMLGLTMDVTDQRLQQERLQKMAHYDALTGLPNRILLADRMKQAMAHAERTGEMLGVVYLDLDGFKPVNDRLGHSAGDELLKKIAERLPYAMRGADSVARLGGDEFVLLLASLHNSQDCVLAMQRAMAAICEPHVISGESVSVTASMGATLFPQDHSDADTLLRHADQAMYIAKQGGRNRFHFFDAGQEQATRSRIARLAELRDALHGNQFVLHLQPRVNMRTGKVLGAEALVRWQHPDKGLLSPAHFLPELEASELNIEFGEWVIASALALLQRWFAQNVTLALSINITARHLQTPAFSTHLAHKMAAYPQVAASQLEIEVTESGSLSDLDAAVNVIEQLHILGIQVSLDDFGTGYSSLTYLRRLPVDTLKIDQSFVRDMLSDPDDRAIVKGVIGLAQSFGLGVVAEGVETREQGSMLLDMKCDLAQGYGIARPMPHGDLPPWALQWERAALWCEPATHD
jgi:diguanylate cyclase (GGDEF)-like protein/PAS domain S-box-containing protein